MKDEEFLEAFEDCTLCKEEWTHFAHVRMAWIYLNGLPVCDAITKISSGIIKYNLSQGNTVGYHDTVTIAFARLIATRVRVGRDWESFVQRNEDLFDKSKPVLLKFYSKKLLSSSEARAKFLSPDLAPLPE